MYDVQLQEGHAFKFDKSERYHEIEPTPGPGHYKIPVKLADVPAYSLPN